MCFCCGSDRTGCSVLLLVWSLENLTTMNRNRWKTIASSFLVFNRKIFTSLQLRKYCWFPSDINLFKLYLLTKRELLFLGRLPDSVYPIYGRQNENKFCEKLGLWESASGFISSPSDKWSNKHGAGRSRGAHRGIKRLWKQEILELQCNIMFFFAFCSLQQLVQWPRLFKYFHSTNSNSELRLGVTPLQCLSRNALKEGVASVEPHNISVRRDLRV